MTRSDLVDIALQLIHGATSYGDKNHGLIYIPGPKSKHGIKSDALEGFARTFLIYAFLSVGTPEYRKSEEAEWFIYGFENGVKSWPGLNEIGQARVEAAMIALGLDLTRDWVWNPLSTRSKHAIISWMAKSVGDSTYPQKNWLWFQIITETFLHSVGGPYSIHEIQKDLSLIDSLYVGGGWYADGYKRAFDHYNGWSFHTYPTLWSRMMAAEDLSKIRKDRDIERLSLYVQDAINLVGGNGSPLIQGRSLIYRFAAAAPFCAAVMEEISSPSIGQLKRAIFAIIAHFKNPSVVDSRGYLTVGWHHEWPQMAQRYSGSGSPYWAGKGLLCLLLPDNHIFWSADIEALPVESYNFRKIIDAPGWCVSGTRNDGIVRIYNFGTDSAYEESTLTDSPLYSRWTYSTHTFPLLDEDSWVSPKDSASVLVMKDGTRSHRTGWKRINPVKSEEADIVAIKAKLKTLSPYSEQKHHGAGYEGIGYEAGILTSISVIHEEWEIRIDYVEAADAEADFFEVSGWPIHSNSCISNPETGDLIILNGSGLWSILKLYYGFDNTSIRSVFSASPLGEYVSVPLLMSSYANGLHICGIALSGTVITEAPNVLLDEGNSRIMIQWIGHETTVVNLNDYGIEVFYDV